MDIDFNFWTEWRGSLDGKATFLSHRVFDSRLLRIELHKFIGHDEPGCFHTHPAWAIRIGLRCAYIEEIRDARTGLTYFGSFRMGDIGIIRPSLCHRVAFAAASAPAYTLWIRGPIVAKTKLIGEGWAK